MIIASAHSARVAIVALVALIAPIPLWPGSIPLGEDLLLLGRIPC